MTAQKYDIKIEQGADFVLSITYKDQTGNPVDLTGSSAQMQVRESIGGKVLASASTMNGNITITGITGVIAIRLPATQTLGFRVELGVYDLFLASSGGELTKLIYGDVEVAMSVTR